ncbi:50S ribosomal protein L35ae [Candidatus Micrarchaeota archaeon]|nr:50S ribosomal protein L35ae [Candidatus Micrarchaeota archaeon]
MKVKIVNPRRGRHHVYSTQYILQTEVKTRKDAEALLGKAVEWKSTGAKPKIIKGKVTRVHGSKGSVVAKFERGLPGQSVGDVLELR